MAEKPSKSKAKVRKSSTDKKSSKADTSKKLKELNENLNQEKDKYLRLFALKKYGIIFGIKLSIIVKLNNFLTLNKYWMTNQTRKNISG